MFEIPLTVDEGWEVIRPLLIFVAGMAIYAIFVFRFYRFIARRDIFPLDLNQYNNVKFPWLRKFTEVFFYIVEYLLVFPLFLTFWYGMLTILLGVLAKGQPLESILLASIAVVATIRVTAYHNEELSKDLAKMLPFALLAIFLIDISYFSWQTSLATLMQIPSVLHTLAYYLIFVIALEFVLRILWGLFGDKSK